MKTKLFLLSLLAASGLLAQPTTPPTASTVSLSVNTVTGDVNPGLRLKFLPGGTTIVRTGGGLDDILLQNYVGDNLLAVNAFGLDTRKIFARDLFLLTATSGNSSFTVDLTDTADAFNGISLYNNAGSLVWYTKADGTSLKGSCVVWHKNGTSKTFQATADTDVARGTALKNALATLVTGDHLQIAAGTFDGGTQRFIIPDGTLRVEGAGFDVTVLKSAPNDHFASIVKLGTGTLLSDLTVNTLADPAHATPIGFDVGHGQTAATTSRCERVKVMGYADGFRFITGGAVPFSVTLVDCLARCNWDLIASGGNGSAGATINVWNPDFASDGTSNQNIVGVAGGGTFNIYGGTISVSGSTVANVAVTAGATTNIYNTKLFTSGTAANDLIRTGGSVMNVTDGSGSGSGGLYTTSSTGINFLSGAASGGASVSDVAYDATTWNGVTTVAPSKNAIRDKIETMGAGAGTVTHTLGALTASAVVIGNGGGDITTILNLSTSLPTLFDGSTEALNVLSVTAGDFYGDLAASYINGTVTQAQSLYDDGLGQAMVTAGGAGNLTFNSGIAVINFDGTTQSLFQNGLGLVIGTTVQAYDADLGALAALSGTHTIYYRSAANTWSAVTVGSGLDFTGATLSATAGGGGTVTSFSAGDLSPLFTTAEATVTTTPALTFTLSTAAANTFFGNGTGSTAAPTFMTASTARTALALVIGTNVEAWDSDLDYLAGFTPSANVKTILNAADYAAIKTALSLTIGVNVQAYDADLTTYAGITPSANVQSFLGAADYAAMKTQLGLTIGTNVQAFDADLTTLAGLTATTDNFIVSVASAWASRTPAQVKTTLALTVGTDVQAFDADLTTWAGITPGTNVGTFLATPSVANLKSALSDETAVVGNLLSLASPSAITWIEIAADNSVSTKTAAQMKTDLSLTIGTDVEAWDADLDTIKGLTATTDNFIVSVASAWASRTPAQVKTTLGLTIGTNVQAWDADLDYLAGFTPAANIKSILTAADYAAVKTLLSLNAVTNDVQTKAAVVPNTLPAIGQLLIGNGLGTAYAPQTSSGDVTVASNGAFTIGATKVTNSMLAGSIASSKLVGTDIATVGTLTAGSTGAGFTMDMSTSTVSGTVPPANLGSGSSITTKFLRGDSTWQTLAGGGDALVANPLSQFAATTSAQLYGVISDETGSAAGTPLAVFNQSPSLVTPTMTTPVVSTATASTFARFDGSKNLISAVAGTDYVDITGTPSVGYVPTATSGTAATWQAPSGGGAPTTATYITQTADAGLSAEQALSSLSTGLMKVTTTTGAITSVVPGTGVETFITTPSSANLRSALTDENGTGVALFDAATTPTFTTGFQIGGVATSRKIPVGNGTNFVQSTETWAVPGTSGNALLSDGTNWTSATDTGGWTVLKVAGSNFTTTNTALTDITGLISGTLSVATLYEFEAVLYVNSSSSAGVTCGVQQSGTGSGQIGVWTGTATNAAATGLAIASNALNTAGAACVVVNGDGEIVIKGHIKTGSTGSPTISIKIGKVTSGTATVYINSVMRYRVAGT